MIRHNTDLLGSIDEQMPDEEVRKHLLELNEDQHDEKREALAVFNNKVETLRMSCVATTTETLGRFRCLRMSILCVQCTLATSLQIVCASFISNILARVHFYCL